MNQGIRVGPRIADDPLFVIGTAAGLVGGVMAVNAANDRLVTAVAGFGAMAGVGAAVAAARARAILRARRRLLPTADGFTLICGKKWQAVADADIMAIGYSTKHTYFNGRPKSVQRTCRLTIRHQNDVGLQFGYDYPLDGIDPLGHLIVRNVGRLAAGAAAGVPLSGTGWVLRSSVLAVGNLPDGPSALTPVADVTAADIVDDELRVWVGDAPHAAVRLPAGGPNVVVLHRVLADAVAARPQRSELPPDDDGLGRVVFERDRSDGTAALAVLTAIGLAACVSGLAVVWGYLSDPKPDGQAAAAACSVLAVGSLAVMTGMWLNSRRVFRAHAHGVSFETLRRTRKVRFDGLAVVTYAATRNFVNFAYVGTEVKLTFVPRAGAGDRIVFGSRVWTADGELDRLRDQASVAVAGGMFDRLQAGESAGWVGGAVSRPDGLELPAGWLFGRRRPVVPYHRLAWDIQDGHFFLFRTGESRPAFRTTVSAPNFFPGLALLDHLRTLPYGYVSSG